MELETDGVLPFLGTTLINKNDRVETKVYIKPTNTSLMLHYDSHVDVKYKKSLVLTMLNRAFRLSSSWKLFTEECERLKKTFVRLRYTISLLDNIIMKYTAQKRENDDHPAEHGQKFQTFELRMCKVCSSKWQLVAYVLCMRKSVINE
jgi:hypothetical protein